MSASVLTDAVERAPGVARLVAHGPVIAGVPHWTMITAAGVFAVTGGWKMLRAWWYRYGPDVVILRFRQYRQ
jgi:hypothetical protein